MKAIISTQRGSADVLLVKEIPIPAYNEFQVLVRIEAIGINPVDAFTRQNGYFGVNPEILGLDFAGIVEAVGDAVRRFKPGDRVAGLRPSPRDPGAYAQYTVAYESQLARLPDSIPFEVGASLPVASLTAYQILYHDMNVKKGQRILIHAGAGGVGIFAIQLAKLRGAYVYTTASPGNLDFLKGLGADEVIDYRNSDFSAAAGVDAVLDPIARETQALSLPLIKPGGILVAIVPYLSPSERVDKREIQAYYQPVKASGSDLERVLDLVADGRLKTEIQEVIPFAEIVRAHRLVDSKHVRGKIVLNKVQ